MIVSMIAAVAQNRVIGKNNQLIWNLPKDMKFFMDSTMGRHIIMGRKNYDSIPLKYRPLKNRTNIIVTRNQKYSAKGCIVVNSIIEGVAYAKKNGEKECFIIGGGQIYQQALDQNIVDKLYITHIDSNFDGDTFFPEVDYTKWKSTLIFSNIANESNPHDFKVMVYEKS
ncbi:MAG: diacylglycerol kinase [Flavobacteriales bacterium]|nr:diacylglycerol kinase [Flavobacteriales bacterium]